MARQRDDVVYLHHIADAIQKVESYLNDIDENRFLNDSLIQDGVIRQLSIIGEAVKQLSPELRKQRGDIPWKDIAGMRDKLVHDYFGVDLQAVWDTATQDIPILKNAVDSILNEL